MARILDDVEPAPLRIELRAHVVLLSDESAPPRRRRIIVAQEVMHHEAELFGLNSGFAV